jgi:hypothetical protein
MVMSYSTALIAGEVSGAVLDMFGSPIGGASVEVVGIANQVRRKAETRADGTFDCGGLSSGRYRIVVRMRGFQQHVDSISMGEGPVKVLVSLRLGLLFNSKPHFIRGVLSGGRGQNGSRSVTAIAEFDNTLVVTSQTGASGEFTLKIIVPGFYLVGTGMEAGRGIVRCRFDGSKDLMVDLEDGTCVVVAEK